MFLFIIALSTCLCLLLTNLSKMIPTLEGPYTVDFFISVCFLFYNYCGQSNLSFWKIFEENVRSCVYDWLNFVI